MIKPGIKNLRWIIFRILAMSPREIIHRLTFLIKKTIWRFIIPTYNPVILNFPENLAIILPAPLPNIELIDNELLEEAEGYINHEWRFFGLRNTKETEIDWHKDFMHNTIAPKIFSFNINHRDESVVGNIKITWEKNRHHHLTILALAYFIKKKEKFAEEVAFQILDWIEQNPYLIGINWTHPLENAIRLVSWIYCERLIRGSKVYPKIFSKSSIFWRSFYEHQKFIYHAFSRGSSANNHLIGEMAGLYISSLNWPIYNESTKWKKFSKRVLENEIIRQTYESGINKELAFSYQIFVLEFFLLCIYESRKTKEKFSIDFRHYLSKMLLAVYELQELNGNLPNYGDCDEGRAIQLGPIGNNRADWLLEIGHRLLKSDIPVRKVNNIESYIFDIPDLNSALFNKSRNENKDFPDAGIFLIKKQLKKFKEIRILFDAGPLGMGSLAAHGHSDALHFTLSIDSKPFFIDPGTYCYHTELEYREYFRSTKAHNTLVVNGLDQSIQKGPFLWSRKYNCRVHSWRPDENKLRASHDGYHQFGITHFREIHLASILTIEDYITGEGSAELDFRFHLSPHANVHLDQNQVEISINRTTILLKNQLDIVPDLITKKLDGGWYSPQFNVKHPTITLSYQKRLYLPVKQKFFIEFKKS